MTTRPALPQTRISPETGELLVRDVRPMTIEYGGESMIVDLPGYYRPDGPDDDAVLVGDDMAPADEALRILKARVHGHVSPSEDLLPQK